MLVIVAWMPSAGLSCALFRAHFWFVFPHERSEADYPPQAKRSGLVTHASAIWIQGPEVATIRGLSEFSSSAVARARGRVYSGDETMADISHLLKSQDRGRACQFKKHERTGICDLF